MVLAVTSSKASGPRLRALGGPRFRGARAHQRTKKIGEDITATWQCVNDGDAPATVYLALLGPGDFRADGTGLIVPDDGVAMTLSIIHKVGDAVKLPYVGDALTPGPSQPMALWMLEEKGALDTIVRQHNWTLTVEAVPTGPILSAVGDPTIT